MKCTACGAIVKWSDKEGGFVCPKHGIRKEAHRR